MAPVLDATEILDESEIQEENEEEENQEEEQKATAEPVTFGPLRTITLDAPLGTAIVLLIQKDSSGVYRSGFHIERYYETSPHDQAHENLPSVECDANGGTDDGYAELGEAVTAAAMDATEWLKFNSEDDDENTQAALTFMDDWIEQVEPETIIEDCFDELPEIVAELLSTTEPIADALKSMGVSLTPTGPAVTDEAQKHFDAVRHSLEERLGKLSIEQVRLKSRVKCNRESLNAVTEELETHLTRGPERLPLFDRAATPEPAATIPVESITSNGQPISVPAAASPAGSEPWRSVTIEDLGIASAICKLLRENNDISTLGQISDWCDEYGLSDLKKIGAAKAAKIEEAMDDYWAKNSPAEANDADGNPNEAE